MKAVLSISGGGMRGIGPVRVLQEIEKRTQRRIGEMFDLIAGTSTGGIVACLASAGVSMDEAADFYYEHGPKIFRSSALKKASCGGGLWGARYDSMDLASALAECMGAVLMRHAVTRVMVTTVDDRNRSDMVKSWDPAWRDFPLSMAALMTASAPTYFPPAKILHNAEEMFFLDGGLVRNAPMACALVEALELWHATGEEIFLLHLGTGTAREPRRLPHGGGLQWAGPLFGITSQADDSYDDYVCRKVAKFLPRVRYERMEFPLAVEPALDDARRRTLDDVAASAWQAVLQDWGKFTDVLGILVGNRLEAVTEGAIP